jgi:hypothetical protein
MNLSYVYCVFQNFLLYDYKKSFPKKKNSVYYATVKMIYGKKNYYYEIENSHAVLLPHLQVA